MKKIKVSSLPLKDVITNTDLLGLESGSMSRYKTDVDCKRITYITNGGFIIKTGFRTPTDKGMAALFRVNMYNHGTYEPNIILLNFWMTSGGAIIGFKSTHTNSAANNVITIEQDAEGYVLIKITAPSASDSFIEDLSSNRKGFTVYSIP